VKDAKEGSAAGTVAVLQVLLEAKAEISRRDVNRYVSDWADELHRLHVH
jgi:hypothetical protein